MIRPVRIHGGIALAAGVVSVGAADALVLGLTTGYFGAGYNSPILRGAGPIAAFVAAGAALDSCLLLALFLLLLQAGRILRLRGLPRVAFAAMLALYLPIAFALVSHRLHRTFGQVLGFDALVQLAGGRLGDALLEALTEAPAAALLLAAGIAFVGGSVRVAARLQGLPDHPVPFVAPSNRRILALFGVSAVVSTAALVSAVWHSPTLAFGLRHKASGQILGLAIRSATDFDRDRFGVLSQPPDPAPFDANRSPRALEIPGNGSDENGLAGDLPPAFVPDPPFPAPREVGPRRPPFLLVLLESFRGDLVGRRFGEVEVTPTLNRLAREGASSEHAFAHCPLTWPSRAQLFQGRIVPAPGARTLIDDFHDLGYRVAYFSGQNDLHGGSEPLVGFQRADAFYDARSDLDLRTSRTGLPASLQVASNRVLERVRSYLDETAGDPRPVFLYVNLVDNHYPYHHTGIEQTLGIDPVSRAEIRPENARQVFETYLQASRHVDHAVGELLALWAERTGGAPVLVTADHGQSFYENGMLGHGQSVDASQSRVPLVVAGIGGEWPEPLGLADVRGLLLTHLFAEPGRARFVVDPDRRVFQYVGAFEQPLVVALRRAGGANAWDFTRGQSEAVDSVRADVSDSVGAIDAVWTWEWLRSHEAPSRAASR